MVFTVYQMVSLILAWLEKQIWVLTEEEKEMMKTEVVGLLSTTIVDNSPTTEGVLIKHIRTSVQGYHNIKSDNIKDTADRKGLEPVSGVLM